MIHLPQRSRDCNACVCARGRKEGGGGSHGRLGRMREARPEARHSACEYATQAVGVEAASEHLQVSVLVLTGR